MDLGFDPGLIFIVVFAIVISSMVFKYFKYGGFKAAMFGAPIQRTIGEVSGSKISKLMNVKVKVHTLKSESSDVSIGLEIVAKSFASYQMFPISLSASEASKLSTLLQSATTGR